MKSNQFMKLLLISLSFILLSSIVSAQKTKEETKKIAKFKNWHNLDLKQNKKNGVSTEKVYNELIKNKTSKTVVVAVIDGGVDIYHEDLKDVIWINEKEFPNNGVDDDKNGYIDDVNGWNFIGNANKENVVYDNLEYVREYQKLKEKYSKTTEYSKEDEEYKYFLKIEKKYKEKRDEAEEFYKIYSKVSENFDYTSKVIKKHYSISTFTYDDLNKLEKSNDEEVENSKKYLLNLMKDGLDSLILAEGYEHWEKEFKYRININYNPREIIGDQYYNFKDSIYGNSDVKGTRSFHGTFVSGIIAAKRDNSVGIEGIADNVKIMCIRVVPDGDERDKDVALSIRYAVNNGAKIINMSFGKEFSPNKKEVLEALEYAADNNVLVIHASGNDSESNDTTLHYPSAYMDKNSRAISSYIEVGASTIDKKKNIVASFSNYGPTTVDIFAPGEDIYSLMPENEYKISSGTSFACPVVSGVAALLWSYYPNLTAKQVKDIIIKSGTDFSDKKVLRPSENKNERPYIKFKELSISGKIANVYNAFKEAENY